MQLISFNSEVCRFLGLNIFLIVGKNISSSFARHCNGEYLGEDIAYDHIEKLSLFSNCWLESKKCKGS